jgi:hypothetical protein
MEMVGQHAVHLELASRFCPLSEKTRHGDLRVMVIAERRQGASCPDREETRLSSDLVEMPVQALVLWKGQAWWASRHKTAPERSVLLTKIVPP